MRTRVLVHVPVLLLGIALFFAYRYGRLEQKVESLEQEKGRKP